MSNIQIIGGVDELNYGMIIPDEKQLERVAESLYINIPVNIQIVDNRKELAKGVNWQVPNHFFNSHGCYNPRNQEIYIYPVIKDGRCDKDQRVFGGYGVITLTHEYGHHLYWMKVKESKRWFDWFGLFARNTVKPTDYAKTNADECFAECFVNYCYGLKLDDKFKTFFNEHFREYKGRLFKELRFDLL